MLAAERDDPQLQDRFGEIELAFQRVDEYRPLTWLTSEHPRQFHLDGAKIELFADLLGRKDIAPGIDVLDFLNVTGHTLCAARMLPVISVVRRAPPLLQKG